MGHFTISAEPDQIETAGSGLIELGNHMTTRAGEVRNHIGSVGAQQWSGGARTAIDQEAQGLANQLAKFGPMFERAGQALKTLAGKVRTAKDTTLPSINSRWDGAETTYSDAVNKASTAYSQDIRDINDRDNTSTPQTKKMLRQDALETRNYAQSEAYSARAATQGKLQGEYDQLLRDLEADFKTASAALVENCVVAVPDKTVGDFLAHGGTGGMPSWTGPDGVTFPPELGAQKAMKNDLQLFDRRDQVLDGEKVAKSLDDWNKNGSVPPPDLPPEVKALMDEHKNDPYFGQTVATTLGPQKVIDIMQKAKGLTGPGEPHYAVDDERAELDRLAGIQDNIANTLSASIAAGSRAPGGLPGFAKAIVEDDPRMAGYLFKYADQQGVAFSGEFMHEAGTALVDWETPDPAIWQQKYDNDLSTFGTKPSFEADKDPTLWFLRAADNSIDSAQGVMGDRNLMQYFIIDQPDWDGRDDQAGNVLRAATIDAARLPVPEGTRPEDSQAWKAAQISSNALDVAGTGKKPLDGVKLPLAGIVATYMPDVDRAYKTSDPGDPGVFDHNKDGWPPGITAGDGYPQFGIKINRDDLRDILTDVGADENARKAIGQSATVYNTIRLHHGAEGVAAWEAAGKKGDSPFVVTARGSTQLQGFLVDAMADADIADAKEDEEKRTKVAEAFLFPLEWVGVDKLGPGAPLASLALDKVKEGVTKAYVGEGVKLATDGANNDWEITRDSTKLLVLDAARTSGLLTDAEMAAWPKSERTGEAIPLERLSEDQKAQIMRDLGKEGGYAAQVVGTVEGSYNDYTNQFGD